MDPRGQTIPSLGTVLRFSGIFVCRYLSRISFQDLTYSFIFVQENLKTLILYIVDSFWEELVKFEHLSAIHSLKVKYDQVKPPLSGLYFSRLLRLRENIFRSRLGWDFGPMILSS